MHELSLCRNIYRIVDNARGPRAVAAVHVQVGQLRQVVPDTLAYCWTMVTEASPLAGSELDIDHVAVRIECVTCSHHTDVEQVLLLVCSACGSGNIRVVAGEEFMVTSIDLAPLTTPAPSGSPLEPDHSVGPAPQDVLSHAPSLPETG